MCLSFPSFAVRLDLPGLCCALSVWWLLFEGLGSWKGVSLWLLGGKVTGVNEGEVGFASDLACLSSGTVSLEPQSFTRSQDSVWIFSGFS